MVPQCILSVFFQVGCQTSAVQQLKRAPCRPEIEKMMARVVRGDALSEKDVAQVFDQIEDLQAVVSCIGGTPADPSPDSQVSWHALSVMTSNKTLPELCLGSMAAR